jgi:hypothetical protein
MKFQLLLIALLSALLFASCAKEEPNCRDNTFGVYEGQDNNGQEGSMELQVGAGEKGVIAVTSVANPATPGTPLVFNLTGEFNESCSILTIPEQPFFIGTISGSFTLVDDVLNGTVTNDSGQSFALVLTKK